jgi:hypothetical protein
MPGELGNEEEQSGVGYYEHKYSPDDTANMMPQGTISDMQKKPSQNSAPKSDSSGGTQNRPIQRSVMKVLRNFTKERMEKEHGKQELS